MANDTLALTFDEIRQRIGVKRGYGSVIADWSTEAAELVEMFVKDGPAMFYNQASYEWSFMTPVASLVIPDGTTEIALPASFGFPSGEIFFTDSSSVQPLEIQNAGKVLVRRQADDTSTGRPQFCAIDEREPGMTHGQRKFLIYWPESDDDYTISLRYSVLPDALSAKNPYPWGGPAHAQTILQACLAKSEQFDGEIGIHTQLYQAALEASKDYDRRVKAQTMGYNGDGPTGRRYATVPHVTYTSNL